MQGLFANVKKTFLMQILHLGIRKGLTKEVLQNMAHLKINLEDLSQTELRTLCVANGVNCKKKIRKKKCWLAFVTTKDHWRKRYITLTIKPKVIYNSDFLSI